VKAAQGAEVYLRHICGAPIRAVAAELGMSTYRPDAGYQRAPPGLVETAEWMRSDDLGGLPTRGQRPLGASASTSVIHSCHFLQ
jgi:hypothetical protein